MEKNKRKPREELVKTRRSQIRQAAQKVFAEKGYHDASIADIATLLQMGHGTFYRYFKNKRDIFVHIVDYIIQQVTGVVTGEDPTASDSLEQYKQQVWQIGDKLMSLFVLDDSLSRLLHYESWGLDDELREKILTMMDVFGQFTELYLINGRDKGFLKPDLDTALTALSVNAVIFEAARRISVSPDKENEKLRWLKAVTQLMFHGIAK